MANMCQRKIFRSRPFLLGGSAEKWASFASNGFLSTFPRLRNWTVVQIQLCPRSLREIFICQLSDWDTSGHLNFLIQFHSKSWTKMSERFSVVYSPLFAPFRTIILFLSRSLVPKGLLTLFILILEWTNGLIRTLTCRAEYAADRKRTEEWGVTKIRAFFAFFYIRINFDPDTIFCGTSNDKYTDWDASQGTLSPWSFSPVEKKGKLCLVPL